MWQRYCANNANSISNTVPKIKGLEEYTNSTENIYSSTVIASRMRGNPYVLLKIMIKNPNNIKFL